MGFSLMDVVELQGAPQARTRRPSQYTATTAPKAAQAASTAAAVLIPVVAHPQALSVLFTQRTTHLRSHSGQVAFPGGRAEPGDASAEFTALREAEEEIGLRPESVEVLARLPDYRTRTGYVRDAGDRPARRRRSR